MLSEAKRDILVLGYSLDTCKEETAPAIRNTGLLAGDFRGVRLRC
jgi:hypothetical protein